MKSKKVYLTFPYYRTLKDIAWLVTVGLLRYLFVKLKPYWKQRRKCLAPKETTQFSCWTLDLLGFISEYRHVHAHTHTHTLTRSLTLAMKKRKENQRKKESGGIWKIRCYSCFLSKYCLTFLGKMKGLSCLMSCGSFC